MSIPKKVYLWVFNEYRTSEALIVKAINCYAKKSKYVGEINMKINYSFWISIPFILLMFGCDDQARQKLSDMLSTPSPVVMVSRINLLVEQGKIDSAILSGEEYLGDHTDPEGAVKRAILAAYLAKGDSIGALKYASEILLKRDSNSTSSNNQEGESSSSKSTNREITAGSASITEDSNSTIVRAGDAVVIIQK